MPDITGIANDTNTRLRALILVNRLGELPVNARGPVLDAWEDILEAALNPTILVASLRDGVATRWIRMVSEVGGTGRRVTSSQEVTEALYHDSVQAILLDADYMDSELRMIIQVRAREMGVPVVLVTLPHKLWMLGDNGCVRRASPALEDIRRTLVEALRENGRGKAESRRRSKQ